MPASLKKDSASASNTHDGANESTARTEAEKAAQLAFDSEQAFQDVLKSIKRQQQNKSNHSLKNPPPFDLANQVARNSPPPNPAQEGFTSAVYRLAAITRERSKIELAIHIAEKNAVENEREKILLFEVLRELLANVTQHAEASRCRISLFREKDEWVLQVEDDGTGIENTSASASNPLTQIGLFQIRTQLAIKGGHLDLIPAAPKGLIAEARLPCASLETVEP